MCVYMCYGIHVKVRGQPTRVGSPSWVSEMNLTFQGVVASTFTHRDVSLAKHFQLLSEQIKVVFMCQRLLPRSLLRWIAGMGVGLAIVPYFPS